VRRIDAVLFDMDGVLIDSEPWWDEVRVEFARAHARPWTAEDQHAVMGANSPGWARIMRERLGLADLDTGDIERAVVDAMVERYRTRPAPIIPGAPDALRRIAAGRPVGIASSSHPDVLAAAVDALGIADVLRTATSSDEVEHGKPAPDVYLLAASRLDVAADACLVVEDSLNGVRAGRAAGMTVVLVPNASVPPAPGAREAADVVLGRLADLDPDALAAAVR
jgi:HAD superfamily hydrolase (TIGR01509 family)